MREHDLRIRRFDKAYRIWRGTIQGQQAANAPAWQARMRVKYAMQNLDQMMVNVVQGAPKAICSPRRPEDTDSAKAMEQILGYYGDLDHLAEKEPLIVQQALIYGVSPAKTAWLYAEQDVIRGYNPSTREWDPRLTQIVRDDRPTLIPWDAYDTWWDPLARNPDAASYIVLRDYPTKDELESQRVENGGLLSNLEMLYQTGNKAAPTTPSAQNQLMGQQPTSYQDRYERWEIWRDNRLTVIGNKTVKLYDGPKPYWMPGKPVVIGNSRPDFLRIEGISETELLDDLQQAMWTHEQLVMENLKMTVMRGATVRETVPDMNRLVLRPNYMWPVTDHDDVHFQDPPPLPSEAYAQREIFLSTMQLMSGMNASVTGSQPAASANDTATGASTAYSAASKLLEFRARMIATLIFQRGYEQWKDLTQQFLTQPQAVKLTGKTLAQNLKDGGLGWGQFGPQEIYGDYDVRVQAGEESLNRQQKRAEAVAVANALAPYVGQFPNLVKPIVEQIGLAYGWEDIDTVLAAQAPQAAPPAASPVPFQNGSGQLLAQPSSATLVGNAR